ncbi:hypothetical protein CISG_02017 [Coccidioides immitis RMSCC 3703]|uniref:Uncharacterized protein n=1 Tax=Coccidioides immitis RMSCC 3703 TaxID=454286 RepID=A0A0J8R369_COCIT|nr:hypothetical protein CISG_02017 [Coccidioides immitis RMSCC 3703]
MHLGKKKTKLPTVINEVVRVETSGGLAHKRAQQGYLANKLNKTPSCCEQHRFTCCASYTCGIGLLHVRALHQEPQSGEMGVSRGREGGKGGNVSIDLLARNRMYVYEACAPYLQPDFASLRQACFYV